MKIITFGSVKGGVGKSSGAIFTALALAFQGIRVVVVDGDPQASSTDFFLRSQSEDALASHSLYHALTRRCELGDCLMSTSVTGLQIIPATPELAKASLETVNDRAIVSRFPRAVKELDAEVVLIDTPPSISLELTLGIYSATVVLVPVQHARWTVRAYRVLADMVADAAEVLGKQPTLRALPAIVTKREVSILSEIGLWTTTHTSILKSAAIRNAVNSGKPLKERSLSFIMYQELAKELLDE